MQPKAPIGRVELETLQYVSEHHPIKVRDVADHVARTSGQARTTVLTVLERLRQKGYLTRQEIDGVNHYSPQIPKPQLTRQLIGDFIKQVLGGSVSPLVAYLSDAKDLKPQEVNDLKRLVDQLKQQDDQRQP